MTATQFWSHWSWPLATAVIGTVFTALLIRQYILRRGPHQLAWAVSFFIYAAAAFMESYSEFVGSWDHTVYRIYIVMAASLVGFLGLGVVYLILRRAIWGRIFLVYLVAATTLFLIGTFTNPLVEGNLVAGITVGGKGLGPSGTFPRIMSLFINIPGTLFLLGGAVYSINSFRRKEGVSLPGLGKRSNRCRNGGHCRSGKSGQSGSDRRTVSCGDDRSRTAALGISKSRHPR